MKAASSASRVRTSSIATPPLPSPHPELEQFPAWQLQRRGVPGRPVGGEARLPRRGRPPGLTAGVQFNRTVDYYVECRKFNSMVEQMRGPRRRPATPRCLTGCSAPWATAPGATCCAGSRPANARSASSPVDDMSFEAASKHVRVLEGPGSCGGASGAATTIANWMRRDSPRPTGGCRFTSSSGCSASPRSTGCSQAKSHQSGGLKVFCGGTEAQPYITDEAEEAMK